jgi:7-cyano-7-deazaguanine reductase
MRGLTQLGAKVAAASAPDLAVIETIDVSTTMGKCAVVRLSCPEFTSLCPVTGQPDFARIYIDYIPDARLVESKSLKLFLGSFRNYGAFHEACTTYIGERLRDAAKPRWMRVNAIWFPRGGISIDCFWQTGPLPPGYFVPRLHLTDYEGR